MTKLRVFIFCLFAGAWFYALRVSYVQDVHTHRDIEAIKQRLDKISSGPVIYIDSNIFHGPQNFENIFTNAAMLNAKVMFRNNRLTAE